MKRRRWMLGVDVLSFVIIVLLFSPLITGLTLHELLGIIFIFLLIAHLLFSWDWIKQTPKRVLNHPDWRYKLNLALNTSLFVLVVLELLSGVMISQSLIPLLGVNTINDWEWRSLHNQSSTGLVIIISLHIAMNWERILFYFKKREPLLNKRYSNSSNVVPVIIRNLKRFLIIAVTGILVSIFPFLILGFPDKTSVSTVNDIVRLKLNFLSGSVQVVGTIITISILAYIARRWLKIRL